MITSCTVLAAWSLACAVLSSAPQASSPMLGGLPHAAARPTFESAAPVLADVVVTATRAKTTLEAIVRGGAATIREEGRGTAAVIFHLGALEAPLPRGAVAVGRGAIRSITLRDSPNGLSLQVGLDSVLVYELEATDSSLVMVLPGTENIAPVWRLSRANIADPAGSSGAPALPSFDPMLLREDLAAREAEAVAAARRAAQAQMADEQLRLQRLEAQSNSGRLAALQEQVTRDSVRLKEMARVQGDSLRLLALRRQADSIRLDAARLIAQEEASQLRATRDSLSLAAQRDRTQQELRARVVADSLAQLTQVVAAAAQQDTLKGLSRLTADRSLISIRFRQTPIQTVLAAFSARSNHSIIAGAGLDGILVTADINEQPWPAALEAILNSQGLIARVLPSGIIQVDAKSTMAEAEKVEALETRLFSLNYAKPDSLLVSIKSLISKRGTAAADNGANAIIVSDIPSVLERVSTTLKGLDRAPKRISIAAQLVYISRTDMDALGFSYDIKDSKGPTGFADMVPMPGATGTATSTTSGTGTGVGQTVVQPTVALTQTTAAGVVNGSYRVAKPAMKLLTTLAGANSRWTLVSFLEMLRQLDLARMEARPLVVVNDNQKANLLVGEQVPVRVMDAGTAGVGGQQGMQGGGLATPMATVQFKDVGVRLTARPHVTSDGQIMMDVEAENSGASISSPDIGVTFKKQQVATRVQVADGETLVLGSLTVTETSRSRVGVPILSSLPFFGRFFTTTTSSSNQRDLVILVTPQIVAAGAGN